MNLKILKRQSSKKKSTTARGISAMSLSAILAASLSLPVFAANDNVKNPVNRPAPLRYSSTQSYVPDQIIVMPTKGLDKEDLDHSIKEIDGTIVEKDLLGLAYLVEVPKGKLETELKKAQKDKNFRGVQKNMVAHCNLQPPSFGTTPNDPGFSQQYYLSVLDIPNAWALGATGQGIVYGSLDTGVDFNYNQDMIGRTTGLFDGIGYQSGRGLMNGADVDITFGHGTMTTNCFGSTTNNNFGFASPCFNSKIVPVSTISGNPPAGTPTEQLGSTDFSIGRGIEFMILNNVKLVNLSENSDPPETFSDFIFHPLMQLLIQNFAAGGGIIFNSAGNSGTPDGNGNIVKGLVVVASVGPTLEPSSFTTWGPCVQFAAPGENIAQTAFGGIAYVAAGTSFSSPLTAGVAGQVSSVNPGLSLQQVVNIMQATASGPPVASLQYFYGYGIPDSAAACRLAQTSY